MYVLTWRHFLRVYVVQWGRACLVRGTQPDMATVKVSFLFVYSTHSRCDTYVVKSSALPPTLLAARRRACAVGDGWQRHAWRPPPL